MNTSIKFSAPKQRFKKLQTTVIGLGLMVTGVMAIAAEDDKSAAKQQNQKAEKIDEVDTLAGTLDVYKLASLNQPWGMESLPNGDILIRRKPDAPIWMPEDGTGEIEL